MNPTATNWKEARRLQAWHLKQQGWSQRQIAEALGVSAGAVSQWMSRARAGGAGGPPTSASSRCALPVDHRTAGPCARTLAPWGRSLRLSRAALDLWPDRRGAPPRVWHLLPPRPCRPLTQGDALEPPKAGAAGAPARRSGDCPLARGDLAGHQRGLRPSSKPSSL